MVPLLVQDGVISATERYLTLKEVRLDRPLSLNIIAHLEFTYEKVRLSLPFQEIE